MLFSVESRQALLLSTLAGLSTTIGGAFAVIKKPGNKLLALLLGIAIGVMTTLSVAEMFIHNAMEHGWLGVGLAVLLGATTYCLLQPFFPDFDKSNPKQNHVSDLRSNTSQTTSRTENGPKSGSQLQERQRAAELLRLGFLMALTMTLHNMPEGFAVAFSSFTDLGPVMALAIAIHNIPEGVIVAAPVYAATGSRWKALLAALASGLSEPVGALIALVAVKPFISEEPLHYILAFVGGIMTAVCAVELWPEAKKCKEDLQLAQGTVIGVLIMAGTLAVGV